MSKRVKQISLGEFTLLLSFARQIHQGKNEPIPELAQDNWEKIDYALQAPFQYVMGFTPYRGFLRKSSVLFYLMAKGHRLVNGNKRMACVTLDYFCFLNDKKLVISNDELVELARYTANSDSQDMNGCVSYISNALRASIVDL